MSKTEYLFRVTMRNFCAGVIANDLGIVVGSAPILAKFKGQHIDRVCEWAAKSRGQVERINGSGQAVSWPGKRTLLP